MLKFLCKLVNSTRSYKTKHKGCFFEHSVELFQVSLFVDLINKSMHEITIDIMSMEITLSDAK